MSDKKSQKSNKFYVRLSNNISFFVKKNTRISLLILKIYLK
jgi:hypothetical protein